ncbi:MAG: TMEM165/GDT1 family protein [Magnetococcales bacterium]|nr:TMEM165/GDT1 family protein [Magnetococcales bacterium]
MLDQAVINTSDSIASWLSVSGGTFLLISLAEIGDKSQLVCMTLAARHRALPVMTGVTVAFVLLNILAVVFGASVAAFLPQWVITVAVALLFGLFGVQMLMGDDEEEEDEEIAEKSDRSVIFSTFLLIFVAEFGDKTQLAIAGLSSTSDPTAVWVGGTAALIFISALGVVAGRKVLSKIPESLLHRISGIFFLVLAVAALASLFFEF